MGLRRPARGGRGEPLPDSEVTEFPFISLASLRSTSPLRSSYATRAAGLRCCSGAGAWRREEGGDAVYVSVRSQVHTAAPSLGSLRAPRCAVGAGGGAARWRRALAGALRCGRLRVEGARGERGGGLSVPQQPRGPPPGLANRRARRGHVPAAAAAEAETGAASATRAAAAAAAAAGLRSQRRGLTRWRRRRSGSGDRARAERGGAGRLRRRGRRLRGGPSRAGGG